MVAAGPAILRYAPRRYDLYRCRRVPCLARPAYYPELTPGKLMGISIPPILGLDRTMKVGQRVVGGDKVAGA